MTTPHPLDDLLEAMLPKAMELSVVVRDRDAEAIAAVLNPLLDEGDRDRLAAMCVALAVMVPDDVPCADLLAWTHGPHVDEATYAQILRIVPEGHKRCYACGVVQPHREFNNDRSRPDGLNPRCRSCIAEARRARLGRQDVA